MYLIFGGEVFYPDGGANDIIENHTDKDLAILRANEVIGMTAMTNIATEDWDDDSSHTIEWSQVYDVAAGKVIYKSEGTPYGESNGVIELREKDKS